MKNVIVVLGVVVLSIVALFASPPASSSTKNQIVHDTDEGDLPDQDFNLLLQKIRNNVQGNNPVSEIWERLKDVSARHIQKMIEICVDKMPFCELMKKEAKNGCNPKISTKIVSALKTILLDQTHGHDDEKLVKQIDEKCLDIIEKLKTEESAELISLLEKRDEIWNKNSVGCTEKTSFDLPKSKARNTLKIVTQKTSQSSAVLLYGAVGAGKVDFAQEAAYKSAAVRLFIITSSEIIAKYGKDAIEFIKMLFRLAKNVQPSAAIIFKEIDALLGKRVMPSVKEELLAQMKANDPHQHRVWVFGLTTQPWEMDENALQHFAKQIHVELPDETARKEIFEKFAEENSNIELDDEKIKGLALMTKNYSFLELETCKEFILKFCSTAPKMNELEEALKNVQPKNSEETVKKLANFEKLHPNKP